MTPTLTPSGNISISVCSFFLRNVLNIVPRRNDILRAKGILPPKDEKKDDELEDAFVDMVRARQTKLDSLDNKDLDELDELEDLEDDQILNEYRYSVCPRETFGCSHVLTWKQTQTYDGNASTSCQGKVW